MIMWTYRQLRTILPLSSTCLDLFKKTMIDWQYLSFSLVQRDESLNENLQGLIVMVT